MFSELNALMAKERIRERMDAAAKARRSMSNQTPVNRVTLREAVAADAPRLRRLAELDSSRPPRGAALVAEVDGRLRAAFPLEGGCAIADPFFNGLDLVELLRVRAAQLTR